MSIDGLFYLSLPDPSILPHTDQATRLREPVAQMIADRVETPVSGVQASSSTTSLRLTSPYD